MNAYNTTLANISTNSPQFVLGINTEIVSQRGGLLSGINVNTEPRILGCQMIQQFQRINMLYFFAYHDIILEINVQAKTIVVKF